MLTVNVLIIEDRHCDTTPEVFSTYVQALERLEFLASEALGRHDMMLEQASFTREFPKGRLRYILCTYDGGPGYSVWECDVE